jgi:hypothetical protein
MGHSTAIGIKDSDITLEQQIGWHLRGNHYPPVPLSMVKPCIEAIDICQRAIWGDADANERIELPEGVLWRGDTTAPAWALVESHHLDTWIDSEY